MPATAEILRAVKAERQPKRHTPAVCCWLEPPTPDADHPDSWAGRSLIAGDEYRLVRSVARDDNGPQCEIYDWFKLGHELRHHRLTVHAGIAECDCEHS